jgi:hypothetical protein
LGVGSSRARSSRSVATRGASGDANGSGAPSHVRARIAALCLAATAFSFLALSPAALAAVSPKGVTGFFGTTPGTATTGTAAGQMNTPRGVAVNQGTGNVYAVDSGNNRVVVFSSSGNFLRAFGADVVNYGPDQANEVQAVDVNAASGNFTLTFNGQTTPSISATATAATVQSELNALSSIGGLSPVGSVSVTGGPGNAGGTSAYTITFGGFLAATNVPQISATNVSLSGGSPSTAITTGTVNEGETGFEICVPANGDFCKIGTTGGLGGMFSSPQGVAVNQSSGDVYVTESGNRRASQFDSSGNFIRTFGKDVIATGFPGNSLAASAVQTLTVTATEGKYKLKFGGAETAELPSSSTAAQIKTALEGLPSIGSGNVEVTGSAPLFTIAFKGALANNPEPLITTESGPGEPLVGGTATVVNTTTGSSEFEICAAGNVCKAAASAATGGAFAGSIGYPAIAPTGAANVGDVLVADSANLRVQEFTSAGAFVRGFGLNVVNAGPDNNGTTNFEVCSLAAGDACQIGTTGTGSGSFATGTPTRVAEDASGNLYTVEPTGNFRVQKFTLPANVVTPQGAFDTTDIPAASASAPSDVAVNPAANSNVLVTRAFAAGSTASCPITGTSSPAESRVLEISSGGALEGTHGTCAGLPISTERGLAARQSTGDLYVTSTLTASRIYVLNTGQPAAPTVSINNVTGVGAHGATISAFINPNGLEVPYGQETTYKFEYKRSVDPTYTPLGSGEAGAGNRATNKLITQQIEGLQAGTSYDVRLVATKPFGSGSATSTVTFNTPTAPPDVTAPEFASNGATTYLQGEINPNGSITTYEFEYVSDGTYQQSGFAEATSAPVSGGSIPAGNAFVFKAAEVTTGLEAGKAYHLRLTVANATGSRTSEAVTFAVPASGGCSNESIRQEQFAYQKSQISEALAKETAGLPNCMALEMASVPQKNQQPVKGNTFSISANGEHVVYRDGTPLAGSAGSFDAAHGDAYVASRSPEGWETTPTILRTFSQRGPQTQPTPYGLAPDFSSWFQLTPETSEQFEENVDRAFKSTLQRSVMPFSAPLVTEPTREVSLFAGASPDGTHLYLKPGVALLGFASAVRLLPGDPLPTATSGSTVASNNTYVESLTAGGSPRPVELLARDSAGKTWGGNCGAAIGGKLRPTAAQAAANQRTYSQGAISTDGSRVYFSTRPAEPAASTNSPVCTTATTRPLRILERTEPVSGPAIHELIQNECTRVSPACDASEGDDNFQGASADGIRVYFTTTRQLANSDLDSGASCGVTIATATGCDLYLYEKLPGGGHTLVQVSAGDATDPTPGSGAKVPNGITAISTDGSHVYFAAAGVLTTAPNQLGAVAQAGKPNLYLYERDSAHPGGRTAFIGTLAEADSGTLFANAPGFVNGAYPVPAMDPGGNIGADGHVLLFASKAELTGSDTDGSEMDVYRYDSGTGSLRCLSCRPGGDNLHAGMSLPPGDLANSELYTEGKPVGPAFASQGRWSSEDGDTVGFSTKAALVPGDTNGITDDYMWRDGELYRLPASEFSVEDTPTVSADGSSVAFRSTNPLLPQDGDTAADAYVARSGGGFPTPAAKEICLEEHCQEPFQLQPSSSASPSETASGGNVEEPRHVKCRKGFARRHGKCVRTHKKKPHHRSRHHHKRAAGTSQGGHK